MNVQMSVAAMNWSPDWAIRSGWAFGGGHLEKLLHGGVQHWLQRMLDVPDERKPERILVCMIYYPDETPSGSWADRLLGLLGYDTNPAKVQLILRTMFERINAQGFDVHGIPVTCIPLFEVLDSSDTRDYVARVEPSAVGGRKMARRFMRELFPEQCADKQPGAVPGHTSKAAVSVSAPAKTTSEPSISRAAATAASAAAVSAGGGTNRGSAAAASHRGAYHG